MDFRWSHLVMFFTMCFERDARYVSKRLWDKGDECRRNRCERHGTSEQTPRRVQLRRNGRWVIGKFEQCAFNCKHYN